MSDFPNYQGRPPHGAPPPTTPPAYGYPQPQVVHHYYSAARTSGLAIASMVLGILWLYWIGSILAVIFGHVSLNQMSTDPTLRGRGMAIAGLVLGYIGVATLGLVIVAAIATAN